MRADEFVRMVFKAIESLGPWPEFWASSHPSGSQRQATQSDAAGLEPSLLACRSWPQATLIHSNHPLRPHQGIKVFAAEVP